MKQTSAYKDLLLLTLNETLSALEHLTFSYEKVLDLRSKEKWTETELESLEAFTSRFARMVDLLVHRLLRSIDRYELQEPGTLLDAANRAEAREFIPSVDWLRELKDTRNRIAHDYAGEDFRNIVVYCIHVMPEFTTCLDKVRRYVQKQVSSE